MALLDAPLDAINFLRDRENDQHFVDAVVAHFKTHLPEHVPSINAKPASFLAQHVHKLVSFRGMICDTTLGQEVYASHSILSTGQTRTNAFSDSSDGEPDLSSLAERTQLVCVDIPGEQPWVKQLWSKDGIPLASLSTSDSEPLPPSLLDKVPVPTPQSQVILVKASRWNYTNDDALQSSLVFDFIGVLDQSSLPTSDFADEDTQPTPIYSLHAILCKPVDLLAQLPRAPSTTDAWRASRDKLIKYLAQGVLGDVVAAEFLLLALLSRVHARKGGVLIGSVPLNLSFPRSDASTNKLSSLLAPILPYLTTLDVSIAALNSPQAYQPTSSGAESLKAGQLQLARSTVVVADETQLQEGQLQDAGVKKLKALSRVVTEQKLAYVFPYSEFDFETDLSVVVLSQGKSLVPAVCVVPIEQKDVVEVVPTPDDLAAWRSMIQSMRAAEFAVTEDITSASHAPFDLAVSVDIKPQVVEADVVALRQANTSTPEAVGPDDLMLRMSVARLLALSQGQTQLSGEVYKQACVLDDERRKRGKQ